MSSFWENFAFEHLTASTTTWELVKCRPCRIEGRRANATGRVLVSKGCLLLRGRRIGRGSHRCRPVKNRTYSHPFSHHSNPVHPNPGTTDRANQYEFCFGCLLCVVNAYTTSAVTYRQRQGYERTPRNHDDNSRPNGKSFIDKICSLLLL